MADQDLSPNQSSDDDIQNAIKLADTGDSSNQNMSQAPIADATSPQPTQAASAVPQTPQTNEQTLQAPAQSSNQNMAQADTSAQSQQQMAAPIPPPPQITADSAPKMIQDAVSNSMQNSDYANQHDLMNGHITSKDYATMFGNESTLGKIGTLFGLALSGAGSGLSHQPNLLMQMMNQNIQNDLEAQKTSAANAQNFLRIVQQDRVNNAQIGAQTAQAGAYGAQIQQMYKQGLLTDANVRDINAGIPIKEAEAQRIKTATAALVQQGRLTSAQADYYIHTMPEIAQSTILSNKTAANSNQAVADQTNYGLSTMMADRAAYDQAVKWAQAIPPTDPRYAQAQRTLVLMGSELNNQHLSMGARLGSLYALGAQQGAFTGNPNPKNNEQSFGSYYQALRSTNDPTLSRIADDALAKHVPGVGDAAVPLSPDEKQQLIDEKTLQEQLGAFQNFANANKNDRENILKSNQGQALGENLRQTLGKMGYFGKEIPNPTSFLNSITVQPTLDAYKTDTLRSFNNKLSSKGLPLYQPQGNPQAQAVPQFQEGATGTHNGMPVIFKGGQWAYASKSTQTKPQLAKQP